MKTPFASFRGGDAEPRSGPRTRFGMIGLSTTTSGGGGACSVRVAGRRILGRSRCRRGRIAFRSNLPDPTAQTISGIAATALERA